MSYFTPLALVAICTAFTAPPSWQALCSWAEFGSRCCRVSVPGCCRVQLQQKSPHCENKAKSPLAAGEGEKTKWTATTKNWEKVIFFSLETTSKQFCHAAAMLHQATFLAALLIQCRRKQEEMNFWYANYSKTCSIKHALSSHFNRAKCLHGPCIGSASEILLNHIIIVLPVLELPGKGGPS